MTKETIKCTDGNIKQIVEEQIELLGNEADLNHLDVSGVTDMEALFQELEFSGDISGWDVSNVTNLRNMFFFSNFDNDISAWDVSGVESMRGMFSSSHFNSDISSWDVGAVTDMGEMFCESQFNNDISKWDVGAVTDMSRMFERCAHNGDISAWNVSSVLDMDQMFRSSKFNGDISSWDVSAVENADFMFFGAHFNGDLSKWDMTKLDNNSDMFYRNGMPEIPEEHKPNFEVETSEEHKPKSKIINLLIKEVKNIHYDLYCEVKSSTINTKEYDLRSIEITNRFIADVEEIQKSKDVDLDSGDLKDIISDLNYEVSYRDLLKDIEYVTNFSSLLDDNKSIEKALSLIFNADEKIVNITQLFQQSITNLKSSLTEEFAWIYDYIRNIANPNEKSELVKHVELIHSLNLTGEDANKHLREILIPIKNKISLNQKAFNLPVPFSFNEELQDWDFKRTQGNFPDVVSINPEANQVNYSLATSLSSRVLYGTSLGKNYDAVERHSSMIVIAINLCTDFPADFSEMLDNVFDIWRGENQQRSVYFSMWHKAPALDWKGGNLDLKELRDIWLNKININVFQTYEATKIELDLAQSFIDKKYSNIDNVSELYAQINERTRAILSGSQLIENRALINTEDIDQKYPSIDSLSVGLDRFIQNNSENPDEVNSLHNNLNFFRADILKIDDIKDHLNHLVMITRNDFDKKYRKHLEELGDKEYTITDLTLISMLSSGDSIRNSVLVNISTIYNNETEDDEMYEKLSGLQSYSVQNLDSFGQDHSKIIGEHYNFAKMVHKHNIQRKRLDEGLELLDMAGDLNIDKTNKDLFNESKDRRGNVEYKLIQEQEVSLIKLMMNSTEGTDITLDELKNDLSKYAPIFYQAYLDEEK